MSKRQNPLVRPPRYEYSSESPYHPRFIEKLLLAIIHAYPQRGVAAEKREKADRTRLYRAIKVLTGKELKRKNVDTLEDLETQMAIAEQIAWTEEDNRKRWELDIPLARVPGTRGALRSAKKLGEDADLETLAARPRKKRRQREYRDYCDDLATDGFNREEYDMLIALRAVQQIVREFGIDMEIDPPRLGMMSRSESN